LSPRSLLPYPSNLWRGDSLTIARSLRKGGFTNASPLAISDLDPRFNSSRNFKAAPFR
jgi:hypothetical protein